MLLLMVRSRAAAYSLRPFSTTTSSCIDILQSRGLSLESAKVVFEALKTAAQLDKEREILARTLPLSALKQMEQSMQDMKKTEQRNCQVKVRVQNENNREFIVKGSDGENLMDLCKRGTELKDYLECACGGNMTCSTCHVYVMNPKKVGQEASVEEKDMIDLAWEPIDDVSRLGCQIKLKPGIDLIVEIPKKAFNHFK